MNNESKRSYTFHDVQIAPEEQIGMNLHNIWE